MVGSPYSITEDTGCHDDAPTTFRGARPLQRKAWLHLATASSSASDTTSSPSTNNDVMRKRPGPLTNIPLLDSASQASSSASSQASRFPFISPMEPVVTLARFSRYMNKVYIPLDDEEELEVGEHGFQLLNGKGSNFALLGTPGSSLLGAGAYGHVYKAIHFPTMRRVAIKKIPKDFGRTNDFTNSFARELRNLYSNVRKITDVTKSARTVQENDGGHCPFLLTLYDAYVEKNPTNLCLVLEYMEGGSLEQMMLQNPRGCRDEGFLREVCHNVLKGLNYLHNRQYLHQDVKPGNILLTLTNFAKLADFGLTVDVNAGADVLGESYCAAVAVGSARYWAPELWGPEKRRDPRGRGDVWGLGLSILSLIHGTEPLQSCRTRSQVEIEMGEAWKEAFINHQSCRVAAEARGIFSSTALQGLSPPFQDFLSKCLRDVADRPTVADLLQHRFIKEYNKSLSRRQRELDEAVQALRTHIQIHKEWKITPKMVELLAGELRIPSSDLQEYLEEHVEPGLMRTLGTSAALCVEKLVDEGERDAVTGAGENEKETRVETEGGGVVEEGREEDEIEDEEESETSGSKSGSSDSLQRNFLSHYDELDRLRTVVIPALEGSVQALQKQLLAKDEDLAEMEQENELLRQQLMQTTAEFATPRGCI